MRVNPETLKKKLEKGTFSINGDKNEKEYGEWVLVGFPRCEEFWRYLVVPITRRIESNRSDLVDDIRFRENIDTSLRHIASAHYSMFMHLAYAHWHEANKSPSRLEDIFTHLVTACDLAETVLEKWYLLVLTCQRKTCKVLEELTREDFLVIAGDWYDAQYKDLYKHYLSKGKSSPVRLPNRDNIIKEYLGDVKERTEFISYSGKIRNYRNAVVHDVKLAMILDNDAGMLVPKLDKIQSYRNWTDVENVVDKPEIKEKDFIGIDQLIHDCISGIERNLNELWSILIKDVVDEFYSSERSALRNYCYIEFCEATEIVSADQEQETGTSSIHTTINASSSTNTAGSAVYLDNGSKSNY